MVNIKLDENWNLETDTKNWILSKGGRNVYFYTQLSSAIESYFELKIRNSEAKTISGLVEYHKSCLSALQQLLAPFKIHFKTNIETPKEYSIKIGGVQEK